jgi:hypothetical protein
MAVARDSARRWEIATVSDAAENSASEMPGSAVVNMWCTRRPKLTTPVPTAASTTQL